MHSDKAQSKDTYRSSKELKKYSRSVPIIFKNVRKKRKAQIAIKRK